MRDEGERTREKEGDGDPLTRERIIEKNWFRQCAATLTEPRLNQ